VSVGLWAPLVPMTDAPNAKVGHFVGESPAINHIGLPVVSHSGAAASVGRGSHRTGRAFLDRYRSCLHE